MKEYPSHKRTNELDPQPVFAENLNIPVVEPISGDTRFLTANKLGNCLLKFSTGNGVWLNTWSTGTTEMKLSADGGTTWQTLMIGQNSINPGVWVIFTDNEIDNEAPGVPGLPERVAVGTDPVTGQTIYQWVWVDLSGVWYDGNDGSKDTIYMAISVYNGTSWSTWKVSRIRGVDGEHSITVNVFKVSQTQPTQISPAIGSFAYPFGNPPFTQLNQDGWYDEPQDAGTTNIWMSQRTYYSDGTLTHWTMPMCIEGGNGVYAVWSDNSTLPAAPTNLPTRTNYTPTWTANPAQLDHLGNPLWYDNPDGHTSVWLALSFMAVSGWTPWQIMRVLGEKGEPGTPGAPGNDGTSFGTDLIYDDLEDVPWANLNVGDTVLVSNEGAIYIKTDVGTAGPYPIARGESASIIMLTNDSELVPTEGDGIVDPLLLGPSGSIKTTVLVNHGGVDYAPVSGAPANQQYSVSIASVEDCTATVGADNKTVYLDTISDEAMVCFVHINITIKYPTAASPVVFTKTFVVGKLRRGLPGAVASNAGKIVNLTSDHYIFSYDKNGAMKNGQPSVATLTATAQNVTLPLTFYWEYFDVGDGWTILDTNSGITGYIDTFTVNPINFTSNRTYRVRVVDADSTQVLDAVTIGKSWDGLDGENGEALMVQFCSDGACVSWHFPYIDGDLYMRQSTDGGYSWGENIRIKGEDGTNGTQGNYVANIFARSGLPPTTPTGNNPPAQYGSIWNDVPYGDNSDGALWISVATKNYQGILVSAYWSTPSIITGPQGDSNELESVAWEMGNLWGTKSDGSKILLIPANTIFNNYVKTNGVLNINTSIFDIEYGLGSVIGVNAANMVGKPSGMYIQQGDSKNIAAMGYYNGTRFTSYFDYNGNFYFGTHSGAVAMEWDPQAGIWQLGNINTGKGIKWNQSTAQLEVVGKFETRDVDTRIVLDPTDNSVKLYGLNNAVTAELKQANVKTWYSSSFVSKGTLNIDYINADLTRTNKLVVGTGENSSSQPEVLISSGSLAGESSGEGGMRVFVPNATNKYVQLGIEMSTGALLVSNGLDLNINAPNISIESSGSASLVAPNFLILGGITTTTTISMTAKKLTINSLEGASGTFTSADGHTITVTKGIITGIA